MQIRGVKKSAFLAMAQSAGLYDDITWQASSEEEAREIRQHCEKSSSPRIVVAPDLPSQWDEMSGHVRRVKRAGRLNAVFISRIDRKKNLHGAIEMLGGLRCDTTFDVYGSAHDVSYLNTCQAAMRQLPSHVRASYVGALPHAAVAEAFAQYDCFFFPTFGENFGHVVVEALAAGCPAIVSDRTPFRDLQERGAGWVLPLGQAGRYREALEACAAMGPEEHARMSEAARSYARRVIEDPTPVEQNRELFRMLATSASGRPLATQNIA
jgi:glycosyltransferase involved in cell wall biosynthesis